MSTKTVYAQAETGADLYLRVFNEAGEWLDFDDDTFKAWASATEPYVAMTEDALLGGTTRTNYAATIDLATLNATPEPQRFYLQCCDNGTPALADDPVTETIEIVVQAGDVAGSDPVMVFGGAHFTTSAGEEVVFEFWLEKDGKTIPLATAELTVTFREANTDIDLFAETVSTPNAAGRLSGSKEDPAFVADKAYVCKAEIEVNGVPYRTDHWLPVHSE
jgi:hypothetical protein